MDTNLSLSCKHILQKDSSYCSNCAEREMIRILRIALKKPDREFLLSLKQILQNAIKNKKEHSRLPEAFSLSEIIDKFIIIALKRKYLQGERLIQNEHDYKMVEQIIREKLQFYTIKSIENITVLCKDLWIVNAEIFCVNDICGSHKDDRVVAAAARKMIILIKERNRIKHEIANELHEEMFETKQFQK